MRNVFCGGIICAQISYTMNYLIFLMFFLVNVTHIRTSRVAQIFDKLPQSRLAPCANASRMDPIDLLGALVKIFTGNMVTLAIKIISVRYEEPKIGL